MPATITSVTGIGGDPPTHFRVTGTATGCERLEIESSCTGERQEVRVGGGTWTVDLPNDKRCGCGDPVTIVARCSPDGSSPDPHPEQWGPKPLPCGEGCPAVSVDAPRVGECGEGCARAVTLTAHVGQPAGQSAVLQWDYGDGQNGAAFLVAGNTPPAGHTETHLYAPGTYTAVLRTILPSGCPDATVRFEVPGCPGPEVSFPVPEIACSAGDDVRVAFTAATSRPYDGDYTWEVVDAAAGQTLAVETTGASFAFDFPGPGTYLVTVTIVTPGCAHPVDSHSAQVVVPSCCPEVNGELLATRLTDCTWDFTVQVVSPDDRALSYEWDLGDGATRTTSVPHVGHVYTGDGVRRVRVTIRSPGCPDVVATREIAVKGCGAEEPPVEEPGEPPVEEPGGPPAEEPDEEGPGCGCTALLILALVLGGLACILGIVAACTANWVLGIVAGVIAVVSLLLLLAWAFACARLACGLYNLLRRLVMAIIVIAPVVAVIVGIFTGLPCGVITAVILWGYWGVVLAILDLLGPAIGCVIERG